MKPLIALTPTELRALLTKAQEHSQMFYVMFLLTACHGLRVSEVINLKRRQFSTTGETTYLTVQRLKGSKKTTQKLLTSPDPLLNEATVVREWLAQLKGDLLFAEGKDALTRWQADYAIEQYGKWASVPDIKCHMHSLKHTTGVIMRQAGCKLEEIQESLGHVSINSTAQYLRITTDEADSARANAFAAVAGGV